MKNLFLCFVYFFLTIPCESAELLADANTTDAIKKQVDNISHKQMDYVEKIRGFLDLIDQPEKRSEACQIIKNTFVNDVISFDWLKSLTSLVLKLLATYFIFWMLKRFVVKLIDYQMAFFANKRQRDEHNSKSSKINKAIIEETISPLFQNIAAWVLRIVFGMIVLDIFKINILPLLFSFSFIGIAITFASQSMIRDLINGIMTLLQGTMAVGEVVFIGESKGRIESISLRSIILRLQGGELEVVPFSSITKIINYSRENSIFRSEVLVHYQEPTHRIETCFQNAFEALLKSAESSDKIYKSIKFNGISRFDEHGYYASASIETAADPYGRIGSQFNKLVHAELLKDNIQFPAPAMMLKVPS